MAIIYGQGYAVTACRNLLASTAARDIPIFVLHDADIDGYNIARTLAESTTRMPDHNIKVIDLGLTVPQAIEYGLETEKFTRKRELPSELELDPDATRWFTGRAISAGYGKNHYEATRCELNAFSSDGLAEFIEDGLRQHGANTKLIPPQSVLDSRTISQGEAIMAEHIQAELQRMVNIPALARRLAAEVEVTDIDAEAIAELLKEHPAASWGSAHAGLVDRAVRRSTATQSLADAVREQLAEQLRASDSDTDDETGDA